MVKTFRCTIVTPTEAVFDEEVSYVSFPAWDGQQGVMHGQSSLLARLGIGSMHVEADSSAHRYLIDGGFAQINENVLTILTERAIPAAEVSAEEGERELADANTQVTAPGVDRAKVEVAQRRGRAKIAMAAARDKH